ncbi:MAG TPA: hypothetical protein VGJ00_05860 [Rhabdochlamydiaceae bacterium]|jgi:predicted nuclease with TOPRIM domain
MSGITPITTNPYLKTPIQIEEVSWGTEDLMQFLKDGEKACRENNAKLKKIDVQLTRIEQELTHLLKEIQIQQIFNKFEEIRAAPPKQS